MTEFGFADIEGAMKAWLKTKSGISSLVGTRVYFGVPKQNPSYPLITVQRIGGGGSQQGDAPIDDALLQFDCWGRTKLEAQQVAGAVIKTLWYLSEEALDTNTQGHGASGISSIWAPDPEDDQPRYVVTASVENSQLVAA